MVLAHRYHLYDASTHHTSPTFSMFMKCVMHVHLEKGMRDRTGRSFMMSGKGMRSYTCAMDMRSD